jgi:hypothetical protein
MRVMCRLHSKAHSITYPGTSSKRRAALWFRRSVESPGFHLWGEKVGLKRNRLAMARTSSHLSSASLTPEIGTDGVAAVRYRNWLGGARLGNILRGRDGHDGAPGRSGWVCPVCRLTSRDAVAARLGFCSRCQDFTGMCGAGRRVVCPDMMSVTSWHAPCTSLGAFAWQITQGGRPTIALLCPVHDEQVREGRAAWIGKAQPLETARTR